MHIPKNGKLKLDQMPLFRQPRPDLNSTNSTNSMANWVAEIRSRAERKLGEMLEGMVKGGGDQKSYHWSQDATSDRPKLKDLGITKSSRVQQKTK